MPDPNLHTRKGGVRHLPAAGCVYVPPAFFMITKSTASGADTMVPRP